MPPIDKARVKEISDYIVKSMLERSYPVVNATHFFERYSIDGKPDPQFAHAMMMLEQGKILRMDTTKKPFSVTFVLLDDYGNAKMHHMIDDEYDSLTFGNMMDDPYEGEMKRKTCYKHLREGYTKDCKTCEDEKNSQICMIDANVLSECQPCMDRTKAIKETITKEDAPEFINKALAEYKEKYWSFEK